MTRPHPVQLWHSIVQHRAPEQLESFVADDVVFRSPAVHTPQEGRERATAYLRAALTVLGPTLTYRREWFSEASAILEFTAEVGGRDVHGIDMIAWNESDQVTEFTVMVRPLRGLEILIEEMGKALQRQAP